MPSSESYTTELYVDKFKGENLSFWKLRFKSKLGLLNEEYNILFSYFEQSSFNRTITDSDFKKSDGTVDQDKLEMPLRLHFYATAITLLTRFYKPTLRSMALNSGVVYGIAMIRSLI